jgi:SnoaL-like domain
MRTEEQDLDVLRQEVKQWHEIFDDFHMKVVELVDLDELVLAEVRFHGRGRASGADVVVSQFDLYRVCEGLITELRAGTARAKKLSKLRGCRSKTLMPTPDLRFAGFCIAR